MRYLNDFSLLLLLLFREYIEHWRIGCDALVSSHGSVAIIDKYYQKKASQSKPGRTKQSNNNNNQNIKNKTKKRHKPMTVVCEFCDRSFTYNNKTKKCDQKVKREREENLRQ